MSVTIYKLVFDSLSVHVAILDDKGVIVETNRAWQEFGRANGLNDPINSVGINYLALCDQSAATSEKAADVASGIRQVIAGTVEEFLTQYPCHSPDEERWYTLRVVRYRSSKVKRVIVTHENITPIMQTQEVLRQKESELQAQTQAFNEANVALKVLLRHQEEDRLRLEETVVDNVNRLILPYIEKLQQGGKLSIREKKVVEIVEGHLKGIISPFLGRITALNKLLTPQEIRVSSLVRDGRTSKEIADVLNVSTSAVDFHRKRMRKKLGLAKTGSNLRAYLLSLQ